MWLFAAETPAPDSQTAIILGVIGLLTAVLVAVATGVFSVMSARANRTTSSPPAPVPAVSDIEMHERVAILEHRADSKDQADDVRDRWADAKDQADETRDRRLDRLEGRP